MISHSNNNLIKAQEESQNKSISLLKPIRNSCPDVVSSNKKLSNNSFTIKKQNIVSNLNIFNFSFQKKDNELNFSFNQCEETSQRKSL